MDLDLAIVGFDDRQQFPSPNCVHPGAGMAFMFSCMYGSGTSSPNRSLSRTSSEGSLRELATTPGSPLRAPLSHEIQCHDSSAPPASQSKVSEPQSPRTFETTGRKNAESAASEVASDSNKPVPRPSSEPAPASPHSVLVPASPRSSPPSPPHRTSSTRASRAATAGSSSDEWAMRSSSDKGCTLASCCTDISVAAVARSSSCADLSHALLLSPQAAAEILRSMPRPGQSNSAPPPLSSSEAPVVSGGQPSDATAAAPASSSDLYATSSHSKWWGGRKQQQQQIHLTQGQGQQDAQSEQYQQEQHKHQQQQQQQHQGAGWHPSPAPPRALAGLKNLGNTCFVNACVQCLNNSAPLALYFLSSSTRGSSRTAEGLDLASLSAVGGELGSLAAHDWRARAAKSAMYGAQEVGSKSLNNIAELDRCGEEGRDVGEWGASCRAAAEKVQSRGPEMTTPRCSEHCRAAADAAADASAEQRQTAPVQLGLAGGWSSALVEGEQADSGSLVQHVERCGGFGPIAEADEAALALGSPKTAAGREVGAGGGSGDGSEDAIEDAESGMVAGACRQCGGGRLTAEPVYCVDSGNEFPGVSCCGCGKDDPQLRDCGNGEGLEGQGGDGEGSQESDNTVGLADGALQQGFPQRSEVETGRLYVQDRDESNQQQQQQQQSGQEQAGGNGGGVAGALRSLVVELWAAQPRAALNPRPLVESVQRQLPQFAGYGQHDSQEFLRALVDQLAAEEVEGSTAAYSASAAAAAGAARGSGGAVVGSSSSSSAGPIQRMFCGQLQSSIECQSCQRASRRCEPFLDLSLPIPKKPVTPPPPQQLQRQQSPQLLPRLQHRHQQQQQPQRSWLSLWSSLWTGSASASPVSPTKGASAHARLSGRAVGGSAAAAAELAAEQAQGWGPARCGAGKGGGGVSITDCMDVMMADERLDGDNKYDCSHCKSLQPAVRRLSIERFPPILVLHLKRTVATVASDMASSGALSALAAATGLGGRGGYSGYTFQKDSTPVACDLHSLDLTRFASAGTSDEPATGVAHSADMFSGAERGGEGARVDAPVCNGRVLYDLYAVMNHMGSISSGHYTAHCRNVDDGQWYAFNDASVERIASKHEVVTPNAYVLFYELRSS